MIVEALTFDDVLIKPCASSVLPNQTELSTNITSAIKLNIPIISSAMDTVTEANLAIAMAQVGGMGVIHRNLEPKEQANQIAQVKKFESGMVVNPVTINQDAKLKEAINLMHNHSISGIPVVAKNNKLVGIITNRDVRFVTDFDVAVADLMTKDKIITVNENATTEEAKGLLHKYRIEKLIVVDKDYKCIGLITVKDIEKAKLYPDASKDTLGRLIVGGATTVGKKGMERTELLVDAGADIVVVDTAHGHSSRVIKAVEEIKKKYNVQVMAGNIATKEAAGFSRCRCGCCQGWHWSWLNLYNSSCCWNWCSAVFSYIRNSRLFDQSQYSSNCRRGDKIFRRSCKSTCRRSKCSYDRIFICRH